MGSIITNETGIDFFDDYDTQYIDKTMNLKRIRSKIRPNYKSEERIKKKEVNEVPISEFKEDDKISPIKVNSQIKVIQKENQVIEQEKKKIYKSSKEIKRLNEDFNNDVKKTRPTVIKRENKTNEKIFLRFPEEFVK